MINAIFLLGLLTAGAPAAYAQDGGPTRLFGGYRTETERLAHQKQEEEGHQTWLSVQPILRKARSLWDDGKISAAARDFDRAMLNLAGSADSSVLIANDSILIESLYMQGRYREMDAVVQRKPDGAIPNVATLGECKLGRLDEALRQLKLHAVVGVNDLPLPAPESATRGAVEATALFNWSTHSYAVSEHRPDVCLQGLVKANELSPHNARIVSTIADILLSQRKPIEALKFFQESKQLLAKMDTPAAHDRLVQVESKIKDCKWYSTHPMPAPTPPRRHQGDASPVP